MLTSRTVDCKLKNKSLSVVGGRLGAGPKLGYISVVRHLPGMLLKALGLINTTANVEDKIKISSWKLFLGERKDIPCFCLLYKCIFVCMLDTYSRN